MTAADTRSRLAANLAAIEERIRAACSRASRLRDEVTLVAVTKAIGPEAAALLPEFGVFDLGESRPQELWRKAAALPKEIRWHLIGHLQRNKIEKTLPLVHLIHSVDSERLLQGLNEEAAKQGRTVEALLEFNLSREPAKHGFSLEEGSSLKSALDKYPRVRLMGLMTMAADVADATDARPTFAALRNLGESWGTKHQLSMGMTNDFEVAIEEGATLVRIGSALFEGLTPS